MIFDPAPPLYSCVCSLKLIFHPGFFVPRLHNSKSMQHVPLMQTLLQSTAPEFAIDAHALQIKPYKKKYIECVFVSWRIWDMSGPLYCSVF